MDLGYGVAVYDVDRLYGGPEEGGWWYNVGELIHADNGNGMWSFADAIRRSEELQDGVYRNRGNLYSVNYAGGAYEIRITDPGETPVAFFPERPPHYE